MAARRLVGALSLALALLLPRPCGACSDPPWFQIMQIKGTPKTSYTAGEQVEYQCRPGFRRKGVGTITVTCGADGTWTDPPEEPCIRRKCLQLSEPDNGRIDNFDGELQFGTNITFVCNEGFRLIGQKTLFCQLVSSSLVEWDADPPICEKVLCKPPPAIQNGKHTNSAKDVFEYSEVVIYSCNPSGGPDEFSLVGERTLVCSTDGEWSSSAPECRVVKCPRPAISNGHFEPATIRKFTYQARVLLSCEDGFRLSGASEIQCSANSTWVPPVPQCVHSPKPVPPTRPPVSTHPGSKPVAPPPWPPDSSDSGDYTPGIGGPSSEGLGPGVVILIVLSSIGGCTVLALAAYKYREHLKSRKTNFSAGYSAPQDKSTTRAEEPQ